eukprot:CAMPEP_0119316900 /NCGR_PEP_ID=MMETSP1333-20130426/41317_1 /TAXON_ID=418940 /ORGANISM="Scyphosphaera apsteinii, Strain RCC1455" /LENGTH=161 /DNA_ID=CAMNT_0007322679 /DNA_START=169 /DNA_END=654 /DNA_ORIENTATION=+
MTDAAWRKQPSRCFAKPNVDCFLQSSRGGLKYQPRQVFAVKSPRCCSTEDAHASARRRKDEQARLDELSGANSGLVEENLAMLKERIDLVETKEQQLGEIKEMLRVMQSVVGIPFVDEASDSVTIAAWIFVGLNVILALWLANALLVEPIAKSTVLLFGGK